MSAHKVHTKYFVYPTLGNLGRSGLPSEHARSFRVLDRERFFSFELVSLMLGDVGGVGHSTTAGSSSRDALSMLGGRLGEVLKALGGAWPVEEWEGGVGCWVLGVTGWLREPFDGRVVATRAASM